MNKVKSWILAIVFATTAGGMLTATALPATTQAACNAKFVTIPAWYNGLTKGTDCDIKSPKEAGGLDKFIWKIALNVINILFQVVGYVSLGFIIYGGFKFMISQGMADGAAKARQTITRAVIGLVISIAAVSIVTLVGASIS